MAVFTIGTIPAKCFDLTVNTAEQWAQTGKNVSISGYFSDHSGQAELVAQTIGPLPQDPDRQELSGTAIGQTATGPAIDNRPDKPAMEVTENYIVIIIPRGATPDQVQRITGVAREAVRGIEVQQGPCLSELTSVHVATIHPKDQVELEDIPF